MINKNYTNNTNLFSSNTENLLLNIFIKNNILKQEDLKVLVSPIKRALLEKTYLDELNHVQKSNEFKQLTQEQATKQLEELSQLSSEIKQKISDNEKLIKLHKFIQYCKDKNLEHDAKWEAYKQRINVTEKLDKGNIESLNDMNSIKNVYFKNKEEILENFKKDKPLGELGEISLNELIVKGGEVISPLVNNININSAIHTGFSSLSLFLMYKGVVKLFDSVAFKEYHKNIHLDRKIKEDLHRIRAKELKVFMVVGAPLIVSSLYCIKQITLGKVKVTNMESKLFTGDLGKNDQFSVKSMELNNFKAEASSSHTTWVIGLISSIKNKFPNWLNYLIFIIINFLVLNYFFKYDNINYIGEVSSLIATTIGFIKSISIFKFVYLKWFFFIGSISSFFIILYYILNIYLYIFVSNNKIKISIYLPQFILNWIKLIERMSNFKDKGLFIIFYLNLILVYLFICIVCISLFFILFLVG